MLRRIRAAAVALAVGAGALALAPPATATTGAAAPGISNVDITPTPIVVADKPVKATFTFTTKGAGKAELQLKAPGDIAVETPVKLTPSPHGVETKWTGTKYFTAKNAGRWTFLAIAHDGKGGEDSVRGKFDVEAKKAADTKIVDFGASPDTVAKGDRVSVSGKLLVDRGGWSGYGGQSVVITFRERGTDAYRHIAKVTTGRGGWFGTKVKVEATGWWRAEFGGHGQASGSVSDTDRVDVRQTARASRFTGFDAQPEPVDKGDRLTLEGTLQAESRHGWQGLRGEDVVLLFKAEDSSRWERVTATRTDRDGRFETDAVAHASGWWKAAYAGAPGVKGAESVGDWVRVSTPPPAKADSRVISFNASPEPVKRGRYLKFGARLQIDSDGHWEGYEDGKVRLYFKAKGSRHWQYVKSTWSLDNGKLYTRAKAWKSGYWKFVYRGDEDTNGDHSRRDYVRVKR
ncbi:hypothetical protein [Nonomuraea sp. NPDC046570]|uniref:hypothetical protein n=1 Tax=Nonomuraea sp. NPDC046570 TaxID=3155255 RepID=UPI0033EB3DCD